MRVRTTPPSVGARPVPRYRGTVRVGFSAALRIPGLDHDQPVGRLLGHDFTVVFTFETTVLACPGVVVDDDMRAEITGHVTDRLHHRDLDRLLDRPVTCEAIATHLASVTVTTGAGGHGEIHLPVTLPFGGAR